MRGTAMAIMGATFVYLDAKNSRDAVPADLRRTYDHHRAAVFLGWFAATLFAVVLGW